VGLPQARRAIKELIMPSQEQPKAAKPRTEEQADDAVQRIRELNEQIIAAAKQTGRVSLDAYERALKDLLDFEQKVATPRN
jgi:hypothetical protein